MTLIKKWLCRIQLQLTKMRFGLLQRRQGFTLIELLVVISIILLMAAAAIPAYQNYGAKTELALKAEEIKALVDRSEAYSKNPAQNNNCAMISFNTDPIKIQFGSINTEANPLPLECSASASPTTISTKDMIDTRGMTILHPDLDNMFAYYTGNVILKNSAGAVVPSANIEVHSARTARIATITIVAHPFSTKITLSN